MIIQKWEDNLVGKKVKCISNTSGSGLVVGQMYYIHSKAGQNTVNVSLAKNGPKVGGWCRLNELELHSVTKEDFYNELKELEDKEKEIVKQKEKIQKKIYFMNKYGLVKFDENTYKIHETMKILGIQDISKAKKIAELYND